MSFLKKSLLVGAFCAASSVAYASHGPTSMPNTDDPWYFGAAAGFGLSHWDDIDGRSPATINECKIGKESDFAARGFIGYVLTRYLAAQLGWTWLPSNVKLDGTGKIRNYALDLSARASMPLDPHFGIYTLLGISYLNSLMKSGLAIAPPAFPGRSTRNVNVTFGMGFYYLWSQHVTVLAQWQRFHGRARITHRKYQPFMDAYTIGISVALAHALEGVR